MRAKRRSSLAACAIAAAALLIPSTALFADSGRHHRKDLDHVEHVLLISIDGMHAVDFANCAAGISGIAGGHPYCPHLAALTEDGVTYLDTSASKPSDSFPGLMAIVAGGSPRSVGAFYDVAYDRSGPARHHDRQWRGRRTRTVYLWRPADGHHNRIR